MNGIVMKKFPACLPPCLSCQRGGPPHTCIRIPFYLSSFIHLNLTSVEFSSFRGYPSTYCRGSSISSNIINMQCMKYQPYSISSCQQGSCS